MELFTSQTVLAADQGTESLKIGQEAGLLAKFHYLCEALEADGRSSRIISRIESGDIIKIGSNATIEIDAEGLRLAEKILGSDEGIHVRKIREHFSTLLYDQHQTFEFMEAAGRKHKGLLKTPLSAFINQRSGNCVTFSVLAQLACQRDNKESYFVQGTVILDGDIGVRDHAWNIVRYSDGSGKFYIADVALLAKGEIKDLTYKDGFPILEIPDIKHEYSLV